MGRKSLVDIWVTRDIFLTFLCDIYRVNHNKKLLYRPVAPTERYIFSKSMWTNYYRTICTIDRCRNVYSLWKRYAVYEILYISISNTHSGLLLPDIAGEHRKLTSETFRNFISVEGLQKIIFSCTMATSSDDNYLTVKTSNPEWLQTEDLLLLVCDCAYIICHVDSLLWQNRINVIVIVLQKTHWRFLTPKCFSPYIHHYQLRLNEDISSNKIHLLVLQLACSVIALTFRNCRL